MQLRFIDLLGVCLLASTLDARAAQADVRLAALDIAALEQEDARISAQRDAPAPLRYALGRELRAGPNLLSKRHRGAWQDLGNGMQRWTLDVEAGNARSLSFGFSRFRLPSGATLRLIGLNSGEVQGPIDDGSNPVSGEFWSPLVRDSRVRLQLDLPSDRIPFLDLEVTTVLQAYRDILQPSTAKSGSCNVDVVCPEGDAWQDQIDSVAGISYASDGNRNGLFCSGQFMNSTGAVGDPLFLTAHHCEVTSSNASSVVAYLKFENSTCRTRGTVANGSNGDGPLTTFVSGATLLAQSPPSSAEISGSDFTLLRFNSAPPAIANVFYSGWDRTDVAPSRGVGIHHPSGDEKRISFDNDSPAISGYNAGPGNGNTHLRVAAWDLGTTEGGSSGSGLWNADGRLVGILSGGFAACSGGSANDNDLPDWYGRIAHAWESGTEPNRRLRDWLDPSGSRMFLDGVRSAENSFGLTLTSPAFQTIPAAGDTIVLTANPTGASGAVTYTWDTNGDGTFERESTSPTLTLRYPAMQATQVRVRAVDGAGAVGQDSRALDVRGPDIGAAAAGAATQVCGNGNGQLDPGERWRLPVRLSNSGDGSMQSGHALFAPSGGVALDLLFGPDQFGHLAADDDGGCTHSWIDISGEAPLPLTQVFSNVTTEDDGRGVITLQQDPFSFYGSSYSQLVVSTNGYLALGTADRGEDFFSQCDFSIDGTGPRMQVLHDDLTLNGTAGSGIRYRRFASCPRPGEAGGAGQPCHVISWTGMQPRGGSGNDEFQAVLYPATGQIAYQYRTVQEGNASFAVIGIASDEDFTDSLNLSCDATAGATDGTAYCIFEPAALPAAATAAVLNQPAPSFGGLGTGASTTVNLDFDIDPSAACGDSLGIDFVGASDGPRQSFAPNNVLQTSVAANCTVSSACAPFDLSAPPRRGLYFNGARPGNGMNGYFYDIAGTDRFFAGLWYTAGADRNSTWYLAAGEVKGYGGELPLSVVRNNATPPGVSTSETRVGRAWVGQIDADSLLFAWQFDDGRSGIERMDTVTQGFPASNSNHTQAWYNPGESGWGVAIESLDLGGGQFFEFFADYIFDAAGNPRWVVGDKNSVTSGTAALLDVKTFCPACAFFPDYNDFNTGAGSMNIQYSSRTSATLSTSILLPAPLSGSWNRTNLPFQALAEPTP